MKILALETSAKSVSAAVTDGGVVRAYTYQNTGLTHSRTLMPLVDAMLRESEQSLSDMDLLAVAAVQLFVVLPALVTVQDDAVQQVGKMLDLIW